VAFSPHRLAPDRLAVAKAGFDMMLRDGTAQNIDKGPWPSALRLLSKKGKRWLADGSCMEITKP